MVPFDARGRQKPTISAVVNERSQTWLVEDPSLDLITPHQEVVVGADTHRSINFRKTTDLNGSNQEVFRRMDGLGDLEGASPVRIGPRYPRD
jgi:hypothetical protein